jgi:hypothetical protein
MQIMRILERMEPGAVTGLATLFSPGMAFRAMPRT